MDMKNTDKKRRLLPQHISIRVPWHDHGWDGTVCADPMANNACLRLKNIAENRNDQEEASICGQCFADHIEKVCCIGEGGGFMSPRSLVKTTEHPYRKSNPATHGHFLPTKVTYPAYSFPTRPFWWLMRDCLSDVKDVYGIDFRLEREPILSFKTNWVQEAENQKAVFNWFYSNVVPDESLCIAYAKQVPFVEDARRVVIGLGHVKHVVPAVPHECTKDGNLRSMTWETMVCHSIRNDHKDGFIIPYREMMEYARKHPEFDMASITVFAPDDAFDEFSYATEHVSHDSVIDVLESCIKSFEIINDCLDEDYSNVLEWLNLQLSIVWQDRGAFPGLGAMLCAMEIPQGVLIAKQMQEGMGENDDIWERLEALIASPQEYLPPHLAKAITPLIQKTWKTMLPERKVLFRLLSRFALNLSQSYVFFNENKRIENEIICSDREIIENPYILYEQTRLYADELLLSVKKVDRAVFPVASISVKYPLEEPTALSSDNDERRIRAIAVAVLECEATAGNTILPWNLLLGKIGEMVLDPACKVTQDILNAVDDFLKKEIIHRKMKDGTRYYKLTRLNKFDDVIEKRVAKRLKASRLEIRANWRRLLDLKFDGGETKKLEDAAEEQARQEKAAILDELASSRISVLVGDAGTGKTSVLSILCNQPDIKAGGVLLLAPTGKATMRLLDSMGEDAKGLTAMNVAQFLYRNDGFSSDMTYILPRAPVNDIPQTVIIDEASMLTEEMFGALMMALRNAKRIIFVGDPNQLPPIGAGRPFVDLVNLLRRKLKKGVFPRVCPCYGELTINRRQKAGEKRLDVEFSKLFTGTENLQEGDIVVEIAKGENKHISFVRWETKEELEEKLLHALVNELGMDDVDDQNGFDFSLGGTQKEFGIFFDRGCANFAEDWQILAPVKNMPHGVMNINRLIHLKYRECFLQLSKRYGKRKRIPKAMGPESIVYGDKVINVVNLERDAWPREGSRNYVANGEIGMACASYSAKKPTDYLNVEFSSQQGITYTYTAQDFSQENGSPPLELAYALTVHKAQGSQFSTVILVLAEPCGLISRELLYTALTRQIDQIVILSNQEAYHLLKYASEEYSDIAKRFTDLFADTFREGDMDMRPQIVQVGKQFFEDRLIHRTIRGELVRSKSEVIIANALHYHQLDYVYEPELILEGRMTRPDFKIEDADTGDIWYWEHCGMMDNPSYKKRWEEKKSFYKKNGIEEGKNLIVTYDENGALDSRRVEEIIASVFD